MKFNIIHTHNLDEELMELFSSLRLTAEILREETMAISAEVQTLLDKIRNNNSLVASVDQGVAAMRLQLADLTKKLNDVPVAPAKGLSADDKGALLSMANDLDLTAERLKGDIPANVPDATRPASPDQQQNPPPVPETHEEDASAAGEAKPLGGTTVDEKVAEAERAGQPSDVKSQDPVPTNPVPDRQKIPNVTNITPSAATGGPNNDGNPLNDTGPQPLGGTRADQSTPDGINADKAGTDLSKDDNSAKPNDQKIDEAKPSPDDTKF